jgi:deazaflavin-dependent oxidoreductase (nitroreductase family)
MSDLEGDDPATWPPAAEPDALSARYDAAGILTVERKRNPFVRSAQGGRLLSALMLPYFTVWPPAGFGVLSTTGRRSGKCRRKCMHVIRQGNEAYIVMLRPVLAAKVSAWLLNIRSDPNVQLRIHGGSFDGVARELIDGEQLQQARRLYCETVNPFDYIECMFHRPGAPTRAKIEELHRSWFETGIPLVIELYDRRATIS